MNFDFELALFYLVVACGVISLFDILFLAKKRKAQNKKMPVIIDYARSFFSILLIVFLLRSFLYEPFRIPSGSLEPTLLTGDFILVNKFDYGIRLPVIHKKIIENGTPKRGDIVVFRWPASPSYLFIKRIIGLPGDRIDYVNKVIYINGKAVPQEFDKNTVDADEGVAPIDVVQKQENLLGVKHAIYQVPGHVSNDFHNIIVPQGMYFAMGDNRDLSADSRYWGFVPDENVVGKAVVSWLSWDSVNHTIRWKRFGKLVH